MHGKVSGMGQVVQRCWTDEEFKRRLIADPVSTLTSVGMAVPEGLTVHVVENTESLYTLVIPVRPSPLSDEDLDRVSAGGTDNCDQSKVLGYLDSTGRSLGIVDPVE